VFYRGVVDTDSVLLQCRRYGQRVLLCRRYGQRVFIVP